MANEWPRRCCFCGKTETAYNNPEPLRDASLDCCDDCNRLVIRARNRCSDLPKAEYQEYTLRLQKMTYAELLDEFGTTP